MPAIIITGINNQNNKAITQTNIKPATFSPMKHIVVSSMQMYCIGIQNGLSVVSSLASISRAIVNLYRKIPAIYSYNPRLYHLLLQAVNMQFTINRDCRYYQYFICNEICGRNT